MVSDAGANTEEVQADLEAAREAGNEEVVRYLEGVIEHRKNRNAVVMGHEIVLGNKEAYSEKAVRDQEDVAMGRPNDPVKAEDLGVRGAPVVAAAVEAAKGDGPSSEASGNQPEGAADQPAKKPAAKAAESNK